MVEVAEEPDEEWKYAVSEVGDGESDEELAEEDDADEDAMAGVFGLRRTEDETLSRESIDLENALFVVAGVALTLFALWQAIP